MYPIYNFIITTSKDSYEFSSTDYSFQPAKDLIKLNGFIITTSKSYMWYQGVALLNWHFEEHHITKAISFVKRYFDKSSVIYQAYMGDLKEMLLAIKTSKSLFQTRTGRYIAKCSDIIKCSGTGIEFKVGTFMNFEIIKSFKHPTCTVQCSLQRMYNKSCNCTKVIQKVQKLLPIPNISNEYKISSKKL